MSNILIFVVYKNKLINPDIQFFHSSILNNNLEDNSFDITTLCNLLQHLVSNNLKNSLKTQTLALNEIFKITKKGGYVVFLEEVNQIRLFSWLVFLFSKIANKFKLKLRFLQSGIVIVSFLSQERIKEIIYQIKKNFNLKIQREEYISQKRRLLHFFTVILNKMGWVRFIVQTN